jgi:hypothetical protein
MRQFETGATRDSDKEKYDYEGFLSPLVLQAFGRYMHRHREQADGNLRASDNWQRGMPRDTYMQSGWRHFMDWWLEHRGYPSREGLVDALCGLLFNTMGYLHETLKGQDAEPGGGVRIGSEDTGGFADVPVGYGSPGEPVDIGRAMRNTRAMELGLPLEKP